MKAKVAFTPYAEEQLEERKLDRTLVAQVVASPQQVVPAKQRRNIAQSRYTVEGKAYLLRAVFEEIGDVRLVVTAYRTSKIAKYWSQEER